MTAPKRHPKSNLAGNLLGIVVWAQPRNTVSPIQAVTTVNYYQQKESKTMLKTYTTPEMIVHGTIEELTEINGPDHISDVLIVGGQVIAESDDSQSITLP
ncbi:MAG: hypothetical protein F6K56_15695 [Moorea sp. SIO3G5]|nr:hypothetical protein [Moorena sp. SIO3G5]